MIKVFCGIKLKTMSEGRKLETSAKWILGNFTLGKNCAADILATCTTMEHRWGKRKHEKPKNTRKILDTIQWTVPTYIINHKKIKIMCGSPKRNEHRNQDKLWQTPPLTSLLGGKKQLKRCFGLAVHFGILDYLFLSVCASNSSNSDLLPIVLHFLNGKDLFQKRYNHQKEILA